ncbi:signal transduction histidine kinase [Actinoplanes lutulentus]|uniref:histidine kinase n=1 Tax=Actinoplanes lutulentus TaxID=1287878 RepID=A0A327Z3P0_9ACTN|nr:ATP-binding protein [Actinoplanes lutulentus]MBB2940333.1 signal transduction histidine kinase [Actinoplanes lutulentus]RAK28826.1 signal transduction histidine kinase [Actinoplanes lutulentus]
MVSHRLRLRLALLLCLMSVFSGTVLLVLMWALPRTSSIGRQTTVVGEFHPEMAVPIGDPDPDLTLPAVALALLAVITLALGWAVAGRLLHPVRTMTDRLRHISERNVHERLSVTGPRDELKDLADTVDGLLGRLDRAFDSQKRFVANAAHELRTPLTVEHALLEEPLIDANATVESYRENFERLLAISDQRARLLESLLTLASSENGRIAGTPIDLGTVLTTVLNDRDTSGLRVTTKIAPAWIIGDPALIERLVANLCDNAIHYNVPGGAIEAETRRGSLAIANTGPSVPAEQVDRLFEPFHRLHRVADDGHQGLGLSIVRAIATAHEAKTTARPRPDGGLSITVTFPVD